MEITCDPKKLLEVLKELQCSEKKILDKAVELHEEYNESLNEEMMNFLKTVLGIDDLDFIQEQGVKTIPSFANTHFLRRMPTSFEYFYDTRVAQYEVSPRLYIKISLSSYDDFKLSRPPKGCVTKEIPFDLSKYQEHYDDPAFEDVKVQLCFVHRANPYNALGLKNIALNRLIGTLEKVASNPAMLEVYLSEKELDCIASVQNFVEKHEVHLQ